MIEESAQEMIKNLTYDDAKEYENANNKVAFCASKLIMELEDEANLSTMTNIMENHIADILGYDPREEYDDIIEDRSANDYIAEHGIIMDSYTDEWN
jgi:hypothetical protein